MIERKSAVIERFADTHAEAVAAARFFRNDAVEVDRLRAAALDRLRESVRGVRVLVVQDTTELNYAHHRGRLRADDADLGPLTHPGAVGFFLHPSLVLAEPTGLPLGVADVAVWNRSAEGPDKDERNYREQPIEAKESYRWIESSYRSRDVLAAAAHVTIVADREGDIYEWLDRVPDATTDLLIRSRSDRRLAPLDAAGPDAAGPPTLYARLRAQPLLGETSFILRARPTRPAREVRCEIRATAVALRRPRRATGPDSLAVWAVEAVEVGAPSGVAPVLWRLLVTRPVRTLAEAVGVVEQYRQRWAVEQLFRGMKREGLEVGASQLTRGAALKRLCVMAMDAAVAVMQLVSARDGSSGASARIAFTAEEVVFLAVLSEALSGPTAQQRNPHPEGSLAWASWVIGRLGGWKCYGAPPGPVRMHRGRSRFCERYAGWRSHAGPAPGRGASRAEDV